MQDPMDDVKITTIYMPPSRGPGSGKDAWKAFAIERADTCRTLFGLIDRQSQVIRELQVEAQLLRDQIATRKPKGGKPKLEDRRVAEIERDLAAGYSTRQIASRCAVSAMTVSRIAARAKLRLAEMG